jgi:2-polyprenyl-3-methyl-5-hydroxy-6-metoxy-1,4-benzoquinol methylase
MTILSSYARTRKIDYFLKGIPKERRILELGCGSGWVRKYLTTHGWSHYVGLDIAPPADIVGDITDWRALGIEEESFDVILAFEVVEHVDCFDPCYRILKPGGQLMLTSPIPHMDWVMKILEHLGLNQRRKSPHTNLVYFRDVPIFEYKDIKIVGFLSQWGIFTKEGPDAF